MVSAIEGLAAIAVDSEHPEQLATFWQKLLGGELEVDDDGTSLWGPAVQIDFLLVHDERAVKNRLHLDLRSVDFDEAVREAVAAGATLADDIYDGGEWQVLRDPEGNEFCILRPHPA